MQSPSGQGLELLKGVQDEAVLVGRRRSHVPKLLDVPVSNPESEDGHSEILQLCIRSLRSSNSCRRQVWQLD